MKKNIITLFILLSLQVTTHKSFAQNNLAFYSLERQNGTAFFSMDTNTGQVYFMLDHGAAPGVWKAFGTKIIAPGGGLSFAANTMKDGTAFFAMNKNTGQVYFMLDFGTNAGVWKSYGGLIPTKVKTEFTFHYQQRKDGIAFFGQDIKTGQVYYMLDYGKADGKWVPYGTLNKR